MIPEEVIHQVVERLKEAAPRSVILLLGSCAKENPAEARELAFLVVEPIVRARRREMVRLSDAIRPLGVPADILVVSQETFAEWSDIPGSVLHEAARKGKVLYAAA